MFDPTPEQIEAAAKAIRERSEWPSVHWPDIRGVNHLDASSALARAALVAAAGAAPQERREKPADLSVMNGWLVEAVSKHTCGAGSAVFGHEPGCGYVPLVNLAELDGYPVQVDEEKLAEVMWTYVEAHGELMIDGDSFGISYDKLGDLAEAVAEWLRGGEQ